MSVDGTTSSVLLEGWRLAPGYCLRAITLVLLIRLFLSAIRACERTEGSYPRTVWILFTGRRYGRLVPDFWQPFILGMIEIFTYPVLLRTDNIHIIGAWIGLKTLAQWREWSKNRAHFNRFLIGNALVVIASVLCLAPMVTLVESKPRNPSSSHSAAAPAPAPTAAATEPAGPQPDLPAVPPQSNGSQGSVPRSVPPEPAGD